MAVVFGLVYFASRRNPLAAAVLGAGVLSHWVLDLIAHRPDLPVWPGGSMKLGLSLWDSLPATAAVEFGLFAVGGPIYFRSTTASRPSGSWGFWGLVTVLCGMQLQVCFGPPPSSITFVAWSVLAQSVLIGWAYWLDRNRPATV